MSDEAKLIVEALLFATHEPVTLDRLQKVVATHDLEAAHTVGQLIDQLRTEYEHRAFTIEEIGGGYLLRTKEAYGQWVAALLEGRRPKKLGKAATEVLAIIAYRQPMTAPQIEQLRGVDCSGPLNTLIERELVEEKGRLEAPGRPRLFGTTERFLSQFGLNSLDELHLEQNLKN